MKKSVSSTTWRKYLLDRQHADYLRTGHPVYAWRAFQIARSKNSRGTRATKQVPEWVLDYFDRCAAGLPQADSPKKVAQALGLSEQVKQKRRTVKFHGRNQRIVEWILAAREKGDRSDMDIFDAAETKFKVQRVADIFYAQVNDDRRLLAKLPSS